MTANSASERVRGALEALVRDTPEVGLQVAAYVDGELVIDAWAGVADPATGKPVDGDTLFMLSSTSKGVASTCMHLCVERHQLSYDMPIAEVWPEFAARGKEHATLRHALCHQTGVPQTPVGYTPEWLPDWDRMCSGIADLKPMFTPGSRTAYHSLNFGYIIGEVLRRVDGRTISQFLVDELGINDAYFGVPDSEMDRVAVLVDAPAAPTESQARWVGEPAGCKVAEVFNRREVLQACIPGSGGVFSARGLARHYALIDESRLRAAVELQSFEMDEIYGVRVRRALGYRLGSDTGPLASPTAFGHVGGGGSFAYADPARGLAIALAKNYFLYNETRTVGQRVAAAVFEALGLYTQGIA